MLIGCHSLIFGALPPEAALVEIARAGYETAVLAEIEGQACHGAALTRVPLLPIAAVDVAAHEPDRVNGGLALAAQLGTPYLIATSGGRPGRWGTLRSPKPPSVSCRAKPGPAGALPPNPRAVRLVVTPRAGSGVWNVASALRLVERGVRLWPDTSHLARAGEDLIGAVRALAPYSVGWFIRDHDGTGSGPGAFETQVPGRGTLDLPGALAALQDAGFTGPAVFHAVGHIPGGKPRPDFPLDCLRALAAEARDYLSRYCTSSAERPT